MSEVPAEEYREYILKLLKLAKEAMEKDVLLQRYAEQIEHHIKRVERGELPRVYKLYPGVEFEWVDLVNSGLTIRSEDLESVPRTRIEEGNIVVHEGNKNAYRSPRFMKKDVQDFHVLLGDGGTKYVVVKVREGEEPRTSSVREIGEPNRFIRGPHAILTRDPKGEGLLLIHLGEHGPNFHLSRRVPRERK